MAEQQKNTPAKPRRQGADNDLPADEQGPGAAEVKEKVDAMNEKGYLGTEADPTPDSAYTVAGVIAGEPTPETDLDHADEVDRQQRAGRRGGR